MLALAGVVTVARFLSLAMAARQGGSEKADPLRCQLGAMDGRNSVATADGEHGPRHREDDEGGGRSKPAT